MRDSFLWQFALLVNVLWCTVPLGWAEGEAAVRLGYFPNITHSQALIGFARGDFEQALGAAVRLNGIKFNAGPAVIEALFAGEIDIAYVGPNPAINGYVRSKGEALRIIAGATNGGAALVVHPKSAILTAADFSGKRFATPQLGNTQDVALRSYLAKNGHRTIEKGGTVRILPIANPEILALFLQHEIDAAWVPEPWAARLVVEGGGKILIDEKSLWPNGDFITALIIVRTAFLTEHTDLVKKVLDAHVAITQWELSHEKEAAALLNEQIEKLTGKKLPEEVLLQARSRLNPTWDPIASSLKEAAEAAFSLGFLRAKPDLNGIYELSPLNSVLKERKLAAVEIGSK